MSIKLDSNAIWYFVIARTIGFLLMGSFFVAFFLTRCQVVVHTKSPAASALIGGGVLGLVLLVILVMYVALQCIYCHFLARSYRIDLMQNGVALHYGVLGTSNELVLFSKIQDIIIRRGMIERMLGLSTVLIQNATGQPERIPGLAVQVAEQLRDDVLQHANPRSIL
jgi:membrane protein YdbS with pleckstrin-like domain